MQKNLTLVSNGLDWCNHVCNSVSTNLDIEDFECNNGPRLVLCVLKATFRHGHDGAL